MENVDPHSLTGKEKLKRDRRRALDARYAAAVERYASSDDSLRTIAAAYGLTVGGLGSYLRRYRRELVLKRHHFPIAGENPYAVKLCVAGQQSPLAHAKYKDAVAACGTKAYLKLNISQIARKFHVSGAALSNFLKVHYPDVLARREQARARMGLGDHQPRGVRSVSTQYYAEAVELYRTTEQTLPQIAEACQVSLSGLLQHLRFYHKDVLRQKEKLRQRAKSVKKKKRGCLLGNGRRHEPSPATVAKYAEALTLYQETTLPLREIAARTGVPAEGFRFYLHKWHASVVKARTQGRAGKSGLSPLATTLRARRAAEKYAPAVAALRKKFQPVAQVAAEFGLHPETLRAYLRKYEPDLSRRMGHSVEKNGRHMLRRCETKYAEAVKLCATTSDSLLSIARRLNLNYSSLNGFLRRHYPELLQNRSRKILIPQTAEAASPAAATEATTPQRNEASWSTAVAPGL